jgi:hypothetical protein
MLQQMEHSGIVTTALEIVKKVKPHIMLCIAVVRVKNINQKFGCYLPYFDPLCVSHPRP